MADQHGNPFLLEETKGTPAPKLYDALAAKQAETNDLNASVEQTESESSTELGAIKWTQGLTPCTGQVEPGTTTNLTPGCQDMPTPQYNYPIDNADPGTEH